MLFYVLFCSLSTPEQTRLLQVISYNSLTLPIRKCGPKRGRDLAKVT
jgi:hypothetical protein